MQVARTIDTVDINDEHIIEEDDEKYLVSTSLNLKPFIDSNQYYIDLAIIRLKS